MRRRPRPNGGARGSAILKSAHRGGASVDPKRLMLLSALARLVCAAALAQAAIAGKLSLFLTYAIMFAATLYLPWRAASSDARFYALDIYAMLGFALLILLCQTPLWATDGQPLGIDKLFHMLSGAGIAWFAFLSLRAERWSKGEAAARLLLAVLAIAALWEAFEWALTALPPPWQLRMHANAIEDTILDIVADVLGAAVALACAAVAGKGAGRQGDF